MLILASASPRRQELLRHARILFKAHPADVPEICGPNETPDEFVRRLACEKARTVYDRLRPPAGTLVLGADTAVIVDGEVLGKPADEPDAARMLRLLSGRRHKVITGVCLMGIEEGSNVEFTDLRCESTQVVFSAISEQEITDYVATGEPMDKAGAYGIQGMASRWIPRVEGCYFNVVGLPVALVYRMLREH